MIVQVYKNKEKNSILFQSKSHLLDKSIQEGYELIEEFEGETWDDCIKKINLKYSNPKLFET